MKKVIGSLFILAALLGVAQLAPPPLTRSVLVEWSYPQAELTNGLTFILYSTTDITVPLLVSNKVNWPVASVQDGLSVLTSNSVVDAQGNVLCELRFPMSEEQRYFVMTASNFWRESNPSGVVSTPPAPRDDITLRLTRGD